LLKRLAKTRFRVERFSPGIDESPSVDAPRWNQSPREHLSLKPRSEIGDSQDILTGRDVVSRFEREFEITKTTESYWVARMKSKKASPTKSSRLASKLRNIRLELGLSQSQILERLGFADQLFRSNISQYERGDRVPAPPVLLAYSRLANVDLEVLVDDELDLPVIEKLKTTKKAKRSPMPGKKR